MKTSIFYATEESSMLLLGSVNLLWAQQKIIKSFQYLQIFLHFSLPGRHDWLITHFKTLKQHNFLQYLLKIKTTQIRILRYNDKR